MDQLNHAIQLRESGKTEEANTLLLSLIERYPESAKVNYQLAWSYDVLGLEREAVPYYEKAISIGLPESDQIEAIIGLGSTYRTLGEYQKSVQILEAGVEQYENNALKVFLAMTKYNLSEHENSMTILLKLLAETSADDAIRKFSKAILYYSDRLNRVEG